MSEPAGSAAWQTGAAPNEWQHATQLGMLTITAVTEQIVRVALTPVGAPAHQTWAIAPTVAARPAPSLTASNQGDQLVLQTSALTLVAQHDPLRLAITRADGSPVLADAPERAWSVTSEGHVQWDLALAEGDRVFGGGQRTGPLDKRGRRLTFWATDPLPNHDDATDALYQPVTFLIGWHAGLVHGIFYDTNWQATADIGKSDPARLSFATTGPDLVAYICAGPTLADVLAQYTSITGRIPPQPRWALGYHQSRWSYMTAAEVRDIATTMRAQQIPCDALYLDIDYMQGFRDFTWDTERFPDLAGLVRDLRDQGLRMVTIIDPGIKIDADYAVYRDGHERGYLVRTADGNDFQGWVWPGHSVWADFARAEVRAWWGEQHRALLDLGVAGIWNDMNEPTQSAMVAPTDIHIPHGATLPPDALHGAVAAPITHAAFHNAYGSEMCRATRLAMEEARPDERAFVLTRATGAGGQRYASVWNGDNTS